MKALYETQFSILSKLVIVNNSVTNGTSEKLNFESLSDVIVSNLKLIDQTLIEQEFDLITLGLVILILARAESNDKALIPFSTWPNNPSAFTMSQIMRSTYRLPQSLKTDIYYRIYEQVDAFYYALQIGFNVFNKQQVVDLDAMATNCRTIFAESMTDSDLSALEAWIRSRPISNQFVVSRCLANLVPANKTNSESEVNLGVKSLHYMQLESLADSFDTNKYPALKQAFIQSISEFAHSTKNLRDISSLAYYLKTITALLMNLEKQSRYENLDESIKLLKQYVGKTADSNAFIIQLQNISKDYSERKKTFEIKRNEFIEKAMQQLANIITDTFESPFIQSSLRDYYMPSYPFGLDNLNTEKTIISWGLLIMSMMLHTQQNEMSPYSVLNGTTINPTYQELKDLLKFEDLEVSSRRYDCYHNSDIQAQKIEAFILLIGKKIYNGEIAINHENLEQNKQRMGRDYYVLEHDLPINPKPNRPIHSNGLTQLVKGGEMHAIELFEEAVAICAESNKKELGIAISALWQESLNLYHFPKTQKDCLNSVERVTRSDLFDLAQNTLDLVKTNNVAMFKEKTAAIYKKMQSHANFIYRLDMVIQAAIGLCLGLGIGLAFGTAVLPAMAVGCVVGLASTRFGLWHQKEYQAYHKAEVTLAEISQMGISVSA